MNMFAQLRIQHSPTKFGWLNSTISVYMILVKNPVLQKNLRKEGDRPNVCNSGIISKAENVKNQLQLLGIE